MTLTARRKLCPLFASAALGLVLGLTSAAPAAATELRLPASLYGQVSLADKQSLGAAEAVADQENVFEPMSLLREDDPLRRLTRSVGRLDLLVRDTAGEFMTSCTGTIVNGGTAVLTASHCIPGFDGELVEASILLDYFDADSDTIRLKVATEPMVHDTALDFALVPLLEPAPADVVPVAIARAEVLPGERLTMVHHPAGLPKKLTQYGCRATATLSEETKMRHRCDTLPGSSGAPIFNASGAIVGTHHTGGLTGDDPKSFNAGTRIVTILGVTDLLSVPDGTERPSSVPDPVDTGEPPVQPADLFGETAAPATSAADLFDNMIAPSESAPGRATGDAEQGLNNIITGAE